MRRAHRKNEKNDTILASGGRHLLLDRWKAKQYIRNIIFNLNAFLFMVTNRTEIRRFALLKYYTSRDALAKYIYI